jgi:adenosine kinase
LRDGITGAYAVFGSDFEIGLIAQKTGWTEDAILDQAQVLVVTYGSKGVRIRTKESDAQVASALPEVVADPTGAGDAFRAGFIKGTLAGFTLEECAKLGSTVSSFKLEKHGTQNHTFTMDQLKERYKKTYGDALKL